MLPPGVRLAPVRLHQQAVVAQVSTGTLVPALVGHQGLPQLVLLIMAALLILAAVDLLVHVLTGLAAAMNGLIGVLAPAE